MPPALGGPTPAITFGHSSGSIDGRTGATNNQASWLGDGWDFWPGFIERRYASCVDDNPGHKTGDQCWFNENATLSLNGHAGELIQSGSIWRLKEDDGTRVEKIISDQTRDNGDDNDEHWKVTTPDGVQYFFGYNKLPGWGTGDPVTNSTWTAPVYGNNTNEPCHDDDFDKAHCKQAWRWNLDYVIDPHSNTLAYFYDKEQGAYFRNNDPDKRTTYDRGGYLKRAEYGMRRTTEYTQAAPLRVLFNTAERCLSNCWTGAAWTSSAKKENWDDTPWDQYCEKAPCLEQGSPTFWSARRLTKVITQKRTGTATYGDVESWTLRQRFINAGTGETAPMWLDGVTHTGHVGGTVTDPEIVFHTGAEPLDNRVDGPNDQRTGLKRWRIKEIETESGGKILITYSGHDCSRGALPTPDTNTKRCMPAFFSWPGTGDPTIDWFHKYVVTRVDQDDVVTDQPNETTYYDYLDAPAWHYQDDEITKDKYKTWGEWRGYGKVRMRHGSPSGKQTAVEFRYLRGMDGDKLSTGHRSESVTDWGGTVVDHEALRGFVRQEIVLNGATSSTSGAEVSSTVNTPWRAGPTATRTRNKLTTNAWKVQIDTSRARTALAAGGYRIAKTSTDYNADGLPIAADDFGDEAVSGDETCTRTSYARNDALWLIDKVSQVETLGRACAGAPVPAVPATVISRTRTFYDSYTNDSSFGAAPTEGDAVRTEALASWTGTTPVYDRTSSSKYDDNGRATETTDSRGFTSKTVYNTSNGGLVTETVATNPLIQVVKTLKEPAWDLPTKLTNPNGGVTELSYDALGRLTGVWMPGQPRTAPANLKFGYALRKTGGPTAATSEKLLPTGTAYKKSVDLFDGFLRPRQNQVQTIGGGRLLTDTFHDTLGQVDWTSAAYYDNTNAPPGVDLGIPQGQIPSITKHEYDGAGRPTAEVFLALGQEEWRTTTTYGGDRQHLTPPAGGTATTTLLDVQDRITELRLYKNPADVGNNDPTKYDATTYHRDIAGNLRKVVDPAKNPWTYTYDLRGRQKTATDPDRGTTENTFDAAGNVLTTKDALGNIVASTYDAVDRKTSLRDGSATGPKRAEWIYDALPNGIGKQTKSIRYADGKAYESRIDAFDEASRPLSTSTVLPAGMGAFCNSAATTSCVFTNELTYKPDGSTATITTPQAADLPREKLTFGYNDIGEQTTLFSPIQIYVHEVGYDKIGQLTKRTLGDFGSRVDVVSAFDEPTRRLTATNVVPELKNEAANYTYGYDDIGNVRKVTDEPQGQTADAQCFTVDYLRRLTKAWTPSSADCGAAPTVAGLGGPAPYWHEWDYDAIGNRKTERKLTAAGTTTITSSYPEPGETAVRPHAVSAVAVAVPGQAIAQRGFSYDAAGNMKTRLSATNTQQNLNWDKEGRLETLTEGTSTTRLTHDADGKRLLRTDPTGTVLYLADGTEISLATGATAGKATRYYSHRDTVIATRSAAGLHWIVSDHHGTAGLTVRSNDLATSKRRSLPFGGERGTTTGWPATMDKGFVGGTKDKTGLTHLGARMYDPAIGRFISVDPLIDLTDPQQWNAYSYGNNSPLTMSDPSGTKPLYAGDTPAEDKRILSQSGYKVQYSGGGWRLKPTNRGTWFDYYEKNVKAPKKPKWVATKGYITSESHLYGGAAVYDADGKLVAADDSFRSGGGTLPGEEDDRFKKHVEPRVIKWYKDAGLLKPGYTLTINVNREGMPPCDNSCDGILRDTAEKYGIRIVYGEPGEAVDKVYGENNSNTSLEGEPVKSRQPAEKEIPKVESKNSTQPRGPKFVQGTLFVGLGAISLGADIYAFIKYGPCGVMVVELPICNQPQKYSWSD